MLDSSEAILKLQKIHPSEIKPDTLIIEEEETTIKTELSPHAIRHISSFSAPGPSGLRPSYKWSLLGIGTLKHCDALANVFTAIAKG